MPEETLYRYKKRLFVALCNCNNPEMKTVEGWNNFLRKFGGLYLSGGQIVDCKSTYHTDICPVCHSWLWFILPKGENFDALAIETSQAYKEEK